MLAEPLAEHLEQTREHARRVEGMFPSVGAEVSSALSPALEGLRREHDELAPQLAEPRLKDLFLAGAGAKTEHLELALYAELILLAGELRVDAKPLERNRDEERDALKALERAAAQLREKLPR